MSEPPRTSGPIDTACRLLGAVVGDMTLAIVRREAPAERIDGWLERIDKAGALLREKRG